MREKSSQSMNNNYRKSQFRGGETRAMKKTLSSILAFALVLTLLVPAFAFAAEKSTLDKFNELKEAGILDGVNAEGDAGLDQSLTRAQLAKVLVKVLGLTPVAGTGGYADVAATHWAATQGWIVPVSEAGLMTGVGYNNFGPDQELTFAELAKVVVTALGLEVDETVTLEGVQNWAAPFVAVAVANGIIPELEDYHAVATRGDLVEATYTVYEITNVVDLTVEASAVGAKKIKVAFNQAVDTDAVSFEVKKGTIAVNTDGVEFADDKKSATITTTTNLTSGTYSVYVKGLTDEDLTASFQAENERAATINITSETAPRKSGDNNKAIVSYEVLNQYGEKMAGQTVNWTVSTGENVLNDNGSTFEIVAANTADFVPGTVVYITGVHSTSYVVVNAQVTIGLASQENEVVFKGVYDTTTSKLVDLPAGFAKGRYVLLFQVKDQYGNVMSNPDVSKIVFTSSNPLFVSTNTNAPDNAFAPAADVTISGVTYKAVDLVPGSAPAKGGSVTIKAISSLTGKTTEYAFSAEAVATVKTFDMSAPTSIVAEGEKVEIPFTALDQYGNPVTAFSALDGFIQFTGDIYFEEQHDGSAKLIFEAPATGANDNADLPVYVTSMVLDGGHFDSLLISVKEKARPTTVVGLKSAVVTTIAEENYVEFDYTGLSIQDQYGRTMSNSAVKSWLDDKDASNDDINSILITTSSAGGAFEISLNGDANGTSKVLASSTDKVKFTAVSDTASTKSFVFQLSPKDDGTSPISTSAKSVTFTKVTRSQFVSYEVADLGVMYNDDTVDNATDADYNKTVEVYGVLANGTKVALPESYFTVETHSNIDVNGAVLSDVATGGFDGDLVDSNGNPKDLTVSVIVTVNDESGAALAILEKDLVVSTADPKVAAVTLTDDVEDGKAIIQPTVKAISASDILAFVDKVVDQYGVNVKGEAFAVPTITITNLTKVSGSNFKVSNNGKTNMSIDDAERGDKFTATIKYASGVSVSIEFTVGLPK